MALEADIAILIATASAMDFHVDDEQAQDVPSPPEVPRSIAQIASDLGICLSPVAVPANVSKQGRDLGRIHSMWGTTTKCVCRIHPSCNIMLLNSWFAGGYLAATSEALQWLASAGDQSEDGHWQQSRDIIRKARSSKPTGATR